MNYKTFRGFKITLSEDFLKDTQFEQVSLYAWNTWRGRQADLFVGVVAHTTVRTQHERVLSYTTGIDLLRFPTIWWKTATCTGDYQNNVSNTLQHTWAHHESILCREIPHKTVSNKRNIMKRHNKKRAFKFHNLVWKHASFLCILWLYSLTPEN